MTVSVADSGPGIAAEDLERIFEEFQQTEAGARQREGMVSALRSRNASSRCTAAGSGATAKSAKEARSGSRCPETGGAMTRPQILVVEDNERNMKLFRDVLQLRATAHSSCDRPTAVELVFEHRPDLVLMDIQLPDIDGVEALNRLRADERFSSLPVLALTAQAMEGDRALPRRGLRRLPLQARRHRGVCHHRESLLRGGSR